MFVPKTKLISSCYGIKNANSLSEIWFSVWGKRTDKKKLTSTPKLEFLPPITEIFLLNILRAHYLEQLPATQTSGNRPLSVKMSHYRIRVSLVVEFLAIHIYLLRNWILKKNKNMLVIDHFLSYLVILINVHPCIKHKNLFYSIYVITTITVFACVFLLLLPLIFVEEF